MMINSYAEENCKVKKNKPAKRQLILATWKPVQHSEILIYLAIMTVRGLQSKPEVRDYWFRLNFYHTTSFVKTMPRERFDAIHHTMLHVPDVNEKR